MNWPVWGALEQGAALLLFSLVFLWMLWPAPRLVTREIDTAWLVQVLKRKEKSHGSK